MLEVIAMSGIHVLSDIIKGGNKLEKTATLKGEDVSGSPANATSSFAMVLSGSMNQKVDPKGQNSKVSQDSEETQSTDDPVQSDQNPNGLGSTLGYGSFMIPNLFQAILQRDLPAGKEANSGNDVSQETDGSSETSVLLTNGPIVSNNKLELALLNLVSLTSDEVSAKLGMTTQKPKGDSPGNPELDKYRQVIAELLGALSGKISDPSLKGDRSSTEGAGTIDLRQEIAKVVQGWMTVVNEDAKDGQTTSGNVTGGQVISGQTTVTEEATKVLDILTILPQKYGETGESTASSPKETFLRLESTGTKDLRQDIAKILQGLMTLTDKVTENGSVSTSQKSIQPLLDVLTTGIDTGNPALNAKAVTLLVALNSILSQGTKEAKPSQGVNGTLNAEDGLGDSTAKGSSEPFMKPLKGTTLDLVEKMVKDTATLTNVQQKSDGTGHQENRIFQGAFRDEVQKSGSLPSTEVAGVKDVQNQISSAGVGVLSNIVSANVADGKTVAVPVWEQISTVLREQVKNRSQDLKQLDIQLHPVDLGKIQIGMRWENGQVHLVVRASEAATSQLLQNQLSDLRQNLTDQGVNCGMLQMGQGGERQHNPHGDESERMFKQDSEFNEDEGSISIPATLSLEQDQINRINVTA